MKRYIRVVRILSIVLFVSGVVFYLLFSAAHPLLHNHHIDGKHHKDCPSCNFIAVASFGIVSHTSAAVAFILFIAYLLCRRLQHPYKRLFDENRFVRGPPPIFSSQ